MEGGCQLHALTAVPPERERLMPIELWLIRYCACIDLLEKIKNPCCLLSFATALFRADETHKHMCDFNLNIRGDLVGLKVDGTA
jgi:hypothetical protein